MSGEYGAVPDPCCCGAGFRSGRGLGVVVEHGHLVERVPAAQHGVATNDMNITDDTALERPLLKTIRNHLIDEAKGTPRGKLRRRLNTLLSADDRFVRGPGSASASWTLTVHTTEVFRGNPETLQCAAAAVRGVNINRWNESGPTPRETVNASVTVAMRSCWPLAERFATRTWLLPAVGGTSKGTL